MKGIVFTEFLEMVEQLHSAEMVDDLIDTCELASGGSYTSVGTYDHGEMAQLVTALSRRTGTPVPQLLQHFGGHLFGRFVEHFPQFFNGIDSALQLLGSVDKIIHVEVMKLYPDAQLPKFDIAMLPNGVLQMDYHSPRHMEDLAEGLIRACIQHYGHPITLQRTVLSSSITRFTLSPQ